MPEQEKIDRRTLIHNLAQGGLLLGLMPGFAQSAWSAVAGAADAKLPRALSNADQGLVAAIADAILPRSDTPGAADVGVPAWIDVVVAEYFSDTRRRGFLADLAAIDNFASATSGVRVSALKGGPLAAVMTSLDAALGSKDPTAAQRGYKQLKELVIVGYFTSKPVQMDLLKVVVVPGHYDPNVRMTPSSVK